MEIVFRMNICFWCSPSHTQSKLLGNYGKCRLPAQQPQHKIMQLERIDWFTLPIDMTETPVSVCSFFYHCYDKLIGSSKMNYTSQLNIEKQKKMKYERILYLESSLRTLENSDLKCLSFYTLSITMFVACSTTYNCHLSKLIIVFLPAFLYR